MRFGLADPRNYDSIELACNLSWLKALYEPSINGLSSRSEITWNGAVRARERLVESGVGAIVAGSPPPDGAFDSVEQVGRVWIVWLAAKPWADSHSESAGSSHRVKMGKPIFWSMLRPQLRSLCARQWVRDGRRGLTANLSKFRGNHPLF